MESNCCWLVLSCTVAIKRLRWRAAGKVIDAQEQWFPWVTREAVSSGRSDPDRVFYPEILWGLQNFKLSNLHISLFGGENLSPLVMLAPLGGQIDKIFENNRDDYRYEAYFRNRQIINGASYNMFEKFKATQDTDCWDNYPFVANVRSVLYCSRM